MDWKNVLIMAIVLVAAFASGHYTGYKRGSLRVAGSRPDTCTIYRQIRAYAPKEAARLEVGRVAVPLVCAVVDTFVRHDTIFIYLPKEQKWYHEDNLYDCWVSGAAVQLDSLHVYQKESVIRTPIPARPLNAVSLRGSFAYVGQPCLPLVMTYGREVGPATFRAGVGYDLLQKKPLVELGAEISLRW